MKANNREIKEWVDLLKKQVSEIYSIYRPVEGTSLHSVRGETLIQELLDFIVSAESSQEAAFYLQTVEKMVYQLVINHVDVLSINRTGESLRVITQAYEDFLRTYSGKRDIAAKNFQNLIAILTKDLQPNPVDSKQTEKKQTYNSLKLPFVSSTIALADHFIKQASEFRDDLKNMDQKIHRLPRKKLHKLIEAAKNIKKIAQALEKDTDPVTNMRLISELREEIDLFIKVSHIHGFDLAILSPQDMPTPINLERCMDTLHRVHSETKNTLPSLLFTPDDAEFLMDFGFKAVGMGSQAVGINALLSLTEIINFTDQTLSAGIKSRDIHDAGEAKEYAKLGLYMAEGITLGLIAVFVPGAIPATLIAVSALDYLTTIKGLGDQLLALQKNQKQVNKAIAIAETFFNSAGKDLDRRLQQLIEHRILKDDIVEETKNPKKYLQSVVSIAHNQNTYFSKGLMTGRESIIARELNQVKGGKLLGPDYKLNYRIISKLCEKFPEPGEVAKILNKCPRDCTIKLKQIFSGKTEETEFRLVDTFVANLYESRRKVEEASATTPDLMRQNSFF